MDSSQDFRGFSQLQLDDHQSFYSSLSGSTCPSFEQHSEELQELIKELNLVSDTSASDSYAQSNFSLALDNQLYRFNEAEPHKFADFIDGLKIKDFSGLQPVWGRRMASQIGFVLDNWRQFASSYSSLFQNFVDATKSQVTFHSIYETIYQSLPKLVARMKSKLAAEEGSKGGSSVPSSAEPPGVAGSGPKNSNNIFFGHFLNELGSRAQKEGIFFVIDADKNKKPISQYIVDHHLFGENRANWKLIFFIASAHKRYSQHATKYPDIKEQISQIHEFASLALEGNELTQPCDQICCSRFFYIAFDLCPLDILAIIARPKLHQLRPYLPEQGAGKGRKREGPVKGPAKGPVEGEGPVKGLVEGEGSSKDDNQPLQLVMDICGLLNRGGGVVLFDVQRQYLELRAVGCHILHQQMDAFTDLVKGAIKGLHPKVCLNKEVTVSFVPLVKNPYEYGYLKNTFQQEERMTNRLYIDGLYVMRIAVVPSQREQLYCYSLAKDQVRTAVVEQGQRRNLEGREMLQEMRRKYQFFEVEGLDEEERALLQKDFTYMEQSHKCVKPYQGKPVYLRVEEAQVAKDNPEGRFKYMSLLVAPKGYYAAIEKILRKKGIECEIFTAFQKKYEFKAAKNSAPIFHNIRFDQLLAEVAYKPEFEFDGRFMLVINVTTYLRLVARSGNMCMPEPDFQHLQGWLTKEFLNQKLRYFTFLNDDGATEHYLRAQSKLSTLFIYYVMHNFEEKTLFKDPKTKAAIPKEDRAKQMVLKYPSAEAKQGAQKSGNAPA